VSLILIIEDEEHVLQLISEILANLGHEVRLARTGAGGLAAVTQQRPDAILLDIKLPDAAGTDLLVRLRAMRPDVPIVMVTANADIGVARATLGHGAFDYVMKPFDLKHLERVVAAALAASAP
jgi:DNA-binding NtrC family response regulator